MRKADKPTERPVPAKEHPRTARGRDLLQEPLIDLAAIQSDLILGHAKMVEAHYFFTITDRAKFVPFLKDAKVTRAIDVYHLPKESTAAFTGNPVPTLRLAVGFTAAGLDALGRLPDESLPIEAVFRETLSARAVATLNDPDPDKWLMRGGPDLHGVFVVTAGDAAELSTRLALFHADKARGGFRPVGEPFMGNVRPGEHEGHEHFGFLDGVSQPGLRGRLDQRGDIPLTANADPDDPDQGRRGQDLIWPGEFIFGLPCQKQDAANMTESGPPRAAPAGWENGAFMVIRRLVQFVPEFHAAVEGAAAAKGIAPRLLGAQIVGRWPNGTPLIRSPRDPGANAKDDIDNDFQFGGDRAGVICPWAAHMRKVYPRDDVRGNAGPDIPQADIDAEEARTQRHRMLRRGIQFGPELTEREQAMGKTKLERGLLFKCYVTDLEEQFEFVQRRWSNNANFVQPGAGLDPLIGQSPAGAARAFLGAGANGAKPTFTFQPWVEMTGGEYFFAPSIDFIRALTEA